MPRCPDFPRRAVAFPRTGGVRFRARGRARASREANGSRPPARVGPQGVEFGRNNALELARTGYGPGRGRAHRRQMAVGRKQWDSVQETDRHPATGLCVFHGYNFPRFPATATLLDGDSSAERAASINPTVPAGRSSTLPPKDELCSSSGWCIVDLFLSRL